MAKISVIVPIYNIEKYIDQCINSILKQTFIDFELILVDDGSSDNCPAICDYYAKNDKRIIVLHVKNGGPSYARNTGLDYCIQHSKSEYISFVDGDDYVSDNFLEVLYRQIGVSDLCMCDYFSFKDDDPDIIIRESNIISLNQRGFWNMPSNNQTAVVLWNKLYKKSLFYNIRFPVGQIFEDGLTIYKIISLCNNISFVPRTLYFYRRRANSIMAMQDLKSKEIVFFNINYSIDRCIFYYEIGQYDLFLPVYFDAVQRLRKEYAHHPFELRRFFIKLKKVHRMRLQNTVFKKPSIGERLFFIFPLIVSIFCTK